MPASADLDEIGTAILFASGSEHNARLALEISHRSYVFEIDKIALSGESESLFEDARIRRAYLGA